MSSFAHYVALGDSMSIDLYPALDAGETDVAVALERVASAGRVAPLGAASLFFRNSEEHWPDEVGDDLATRYPGIGFTNLATDGATIGDVFSEQLWQLEQHDESMLVTLTIGGSDLPGAFGLRPSKWLLSSFAADIVEAYELLIDSVRARLGSGTLIATTVFDPSDETGVLPGLADQASPLPLDVLSILNDRIRLLAQDRANVVLADAHRHFLGHGITAPEEDRWYWRRSLVEPNARGASELRALWRSALASVGDG